jgi:putative PIN family toxin of toxin-antitoxin system
MKIVLDTNVLIAAFISHGTCNELMEHCALNHEVVLSPFILDEFKRKLIRKFRFTTHEAEVAVNLLESRFEVVKPLELAKPICRDADDDQIIGTALAGNCEYIVTGDKDLLDLRRAKQIRMISPSDFWALEE